MKISRQSLRFLHRRGTTFVIRQRRVFGFVGLMAIAVLVLLRSMSEQRSSLQASLPRSLPKEIKHDLSPEYLRQLAPRPRNFSDILDHAYTLTTRHCSFRADQIQKRADKYGIALEKFYGVHSSEFSLRNPPIPIRDVPKDDWVSTGQVGIFLSHLQVWRDALEKGYRNVFINEDDVFFSDSIGSRFMDIYQLIQGAASVHNRSWSMMVFRRNPAYEVKWEEKWSPLLNGYNVTIAGPSWGCGAYILSRQGMEFLVDHTDHYSLPIDVYLEKLQKIYPREFIILSLCNNEDENDVFKSCPASAVELSDKEKRHCISGTQAGERWPSSAFPTSPAEKKVQNRSAST